MFPRAWKLGLATDSTDASFPSRVDVATSATVTDAAPNATAIQNEGDGVWVIPFGVSADNDTMDMRVIGWSRSVNSTGHTWTPTVICQLACIHCTDVGVAGGNPGATDRYCDSITTTNGLAVTPSAFTNTRARAFVDITGFEFFEFTFDLGAGTNANCLWLATGEEGV